MKEKRGDPMYIHQIQLDRLKKKVKPGKVIIIYGPRRTGKTTLLEQFLIDQSNYLLLNGDDIFTHQYLSSQSAQKIKDLVGTKELIVIDEAQNIPNIGINLKILVDTLPSVKVVITGSAMIDLASGIGEPLTGRKQTLLLYPLSQMELQENESPTDSQANLEKRLLYGSYPEVILLHSDEERREYLHELVDSVLLKDILQFEGVRKSRKIIDLLQLIALQLGKEVSCSELGSQIGLNKATVEKYLDLLEKIFVIKRIGGFSKNLRKEITKNAKYYFIDTGLRNALINNFNALALRKDRGDIWENYLIAERLKKQSYHSMHTNNYFWRTYDQQEIDWIEEREGELLAFEFKWKKTTYAPPQLWESTYHSTCTIISRENYLSFIM